MVKATKKTHAIKLASELNIIQNIAFHGFEPDIYPKIAKSDLLVIPSIREGMPNVLIEAMAIGFLSWHQKLRRSKTL